MSSFKRLRLLSLIAGSAVAGCGGGGSASTSSTPPPVVSSSILPVGGTPGAVLATDATILRPLVAGGSWTYRGHTTATTGAGANVTTVFEDVVTQRAVGAGTNEDSSNQFNQGTRSVQLAQVAGVVTLTDPSGASLGVTSYPELRSPVRVNDQYVVLDQHLADSGLDVDGDGKHDASDIAIYRVVVGAEDVTFEHTPTRHAIRVDMIALVRYTLSSNGQNTPVLTAVTQSTWYAPGIGVVRQRLTSPVTPTSNSISDEVLVNWDEVTTGEGYTAPLSAVVPVGSSIAAGTPIQVPTSVATFADHALALTRIPGSSGAGYALHTVDKRGQVTTTLPYGASAALADQVQLVAVGTSAVVVEPRPSGAALDVFDQYGVQQGPMPVRTIDLTGGVQILSGLKIVAAGDDSRLWLVWVRDYTGSTFGDYRNDLVARAFDLAGHALTGEILLEAGVARQAFNGLSASAKPGGLIVGYLIHATSGIATRLASVDATSGAVTQQSFDQQWTPSVLAGSSGAMMFWQSSNGNDITTTMQQGIRLDASLQPVLAAGAPLANQTLSGPWGIWPSSPAIVSAGSSFSALSVEGQGQLWSDDNTPSHFIIVANYANGNGQLIAAAAGPFVRIPLSLLPYRSGQAVFSDRVVLFGSIAQGPLMTSIAWVH